MANTSLSVWRAQLEQLPRFVRGHFSMVEVPSYATNIDLYKPELRYVHGPTLDAILTAMKEAEEQQPPRETRPDCEHGDCRDHYGDPAAWCNRCRAQHPVENTAAAPPRETP